MIVQLRPLRPDLALRALERLHYPSLSSKPATCLRQRLQRSGILTQHTVRQKSKQAGPVATVYEPNIARWNRYEDPSEVITEPKLRNPLNYFERERQRVRHNQYLKRRMLFAGIGLGACVVAQVVLVFTFGDEPAPTNSTQTAIGKVEHLDARSPKEGEPGFPNDGKGVHVVGQKPGVPGIMLDEEGNELVVTGNSTIPYFPRNIRLPTTPSTQTTATSDALPAAASANTGKRDEEYTLLGHGIRTVSFLSVQVYYFGVYVRTSDLPELQRRFINQANANATSLIPPEKQALREKLLDGERSREVWDAVLRQSGVKSAVRIVPVKNTDFHHMRDGWVRSITTRKQEAAAEVLKAGDQASSEFDDEGFANAMGDFKGMFVGRKVPWGSVLVLSREGDGALGFSFQSAPSKEQKERKIPVPGEEIGRIEDERIARLVWLGYLGGKKVSSEAARKSVVEGVMELVERPMGTVGVGLA